MEVDNALKEETHLMKTGKVVGIISRRWRDYVASFPQDGDSFNIGQERVLVNPYDIRIPRIRILTRQAENLATHRYPYSHHFFSSNCKSSNRILILKINATSTLFNQ